MEVDSKLKHDHIQNQRAEAPSGTCTRARTHASTRITFFRHQVQLVTLGLPAGTLHVRGGITGSRVAPRTCRTKEFAQAREAGIQGSVTVSREDSRDLPGFSVPS